MIHNDVLRSLRYLLDVNDAKLTDIIKLTGFEVSTADIAAYLKKEDEEGFVRCPDEVIAYFLDGLGQTIFGSDIYQIDVGMPKDPIFLLEGCLLYTSDAADE